MSSTIAGQDNFSWWIMLFTEDDEKRLIQFTKLWLKQIRPETVIMTDFEGTSLLTVKQLSEEIESGSERGQRMLRSLIMTKVQEVLIISR